MKVDYVAQADPHGCVIAACAMLLGRTYTDVKAEVVARYGGDQPWRDGMSQFDAQKLLEEGGYYWQLRYRWFFNNKQREVWPPEPWAELHYCEVIVKGGTGGAHAVVMLRDGSILDPLTPERRHLRDYEKVNAIIGLVRPEGT